MTSPPAWEPPPPSQFPLHVLAGHPEAPAFTSPSHDVSGTWWWNGTSWVPAFSNDWSRWWTGNSWMGTVSEDGYYWTGTQWLPLGPLRPEEIPSDGSRPDLDPKLRRSSFRALIAGISVIGVYAALVIFLSIITIASNVPQEGELGEGLDDWISAAIPAAIVLIVVVATLTSRVTGLVKIPRFTGLSAAGYVVVGVAAAACALYAVTIVTTIPENGSRIWAFLLTGLFIGMFEELMVRGLLFNGLLYRMQPIWAIVISSLVFGALHLSNLPFVANKWTVAFQVGNTIFAGIFFACLRYVTMSIWPCIVIHGLLDASIGTLGGSESLIALLPLLGTFICFITAIVMLFLHKNLKPVGQRAHDNSPASAEAFSLT